MTFKQSIFREGFSIPSDTTGINLWLHHRRLEGREAFGSMRTIIMMHGATYSSGSLFDIPLEGESFMDYLAAAGFDVWALDVRGYGGSTRPDCMNAPAADNPPSVQANVAVRDLSTAIDYVLTRQNLESLNVIGMSWGGTVSSLYTTKNNEKVRRLALIAPQWLLKGPAALDPGGKLGAWRDITIDDIEARWLRSVPEHKKQDLIPAGGFALWANQTLAEEPDQELRDHRRFRAGNGPVQDTREYWTAGVPVYLPADIRVPVLLLHGEWDADVPVDLACSWFLAATHVPWKRWVEFGEATHMMVLEKNRYQVWEEISRFFSHPLPV
ncbi:alpha/beta hydrolase [Pantoea sp. YR343]|uniref:alpha/beta hydrolase n=1 Tax=Pantoea sp. YR343 TaxID=1144341 RepID=UPI0002714A2F|nr:alpha/beta hydrolase [Pantoea sp. YR343]KAJ9430785.1 alpha/beta hydrolase [Pantoea sp. YR343]